MAWSTWTAAIAVAVAAQAVSGARAARGDDTPRPVSAEVRAAVRDYLEAPPKKEAAALSKALALLKDDVALAAEALRSHAPLSKGKPGATHGISFESGGQSWEYSVLLPKDYDGKRRFPVLVLPDHGSVSPEDGIGFWEGKDGVDEYVVFRPVITKFQEDKKRFPDQQFFARDQAIARVMEDALAHLRLHYAVDPDRFSMTGLSQAGYYTWYYAVTFPDAFAGVVPESSGGVGVRAAVLPLARNLASVAVRILHAEGDQVCPYADAKAMRDAIASANGKVDLVTYTDADYSGAPFPKRHPGPHDKRLANVLPWGVTVRREIPRSFTRVIRYATQGFEGRFRIPPPEKVEKAFTVACEEKDGVLSADHAGVSYLVSPEDVVARRVFKVSGREVTPKADVKLLLTSFKSHGDTGRLAAAEIRVTAP